MDSEVRNLPREKPSDILEETTNTTGKKLASWRQKLQKEASMDWTAVSEWIIKNSYFSKHKKLTVVYIMHPRKMQIRSARCVLYETEAVNY